MPSPAALAKYVVALMVAPLNQEAVSTTNSREAMRSPLYQETMNTPFYQGSAHIAGNSGIYLCQHGGFTGHCRHFSAPFGQCSKSTPCLCRAI